MLDFSSLCVFNTELAKADMAVCSVSRTHVESLLDESVLGAGGGGTQPLPEQLAVTWHRPGLGPRHEP